MTRVILVHCGNCKTGLGFLAPLGPCVTCIHVNQEVLYMVITTERVAYNPTVEVFESVSLSVCENTISHTHL